MKIAARRERLLRTGATEPIMVRQLSFASGGTEPTMQIAYTLGRILLPLVFIFEGVRKLMNVDEIAKMLADNNVPVPDEIVPYLGGMPKFQAAGYTVAGVEVICGLMILVGLKARWAAIVLIVFTAATIFFVHHFWDMDAAVMAVQRIEALKNLSIMGGLLLIVAMGSGPGAMDRQ
jgi:putative oxidoreductase